MFRGLLSQQASSRKSFDLKNDNLSSIMGQDDPFCENANLLQTDRDYLPPTFRECQRSEKSVCAVEMTQNAYFSLTDVNNTSSPRKDNSRTNIPVISAMGLFHRSLQQDSPDSDFRLGTFANGLEAKHRRVVGIDQDDSDRSYGEESGDQEILFQFRSVEDDD